MVFLMPFQVAVNLSMHLAIPWNALHYFSAPSLCLTYLKPLVPNSLVILVVHIFQQGPWQM